MHLENIVVDAVDPQRLGRFWEAALGTATLTDAPGIFETRLSVDEGPTLDLCFQQVPEPPTVAPRLHLDLLGGADQADVVDRLLGLGAQPLDIGQGDVPWVVLADPEGNPCCVLEERAVYTDTGPVAALPLASADPDRDATLWSWLTGWTDAEAAVAAAPHAPGPAAGDVHGAGTQGSGKEPAAPRRPARGRRGRRRRRGRRP